MSFLKSLFSSSEKKPCSVCGKMTGIVCVSCQKPVCKRHGKFLEFNLEGEKLSGWSHESESCSFSAMWVILTKSKSAADMVKQLTDSECCCAKAGCRGMVDLEEPLPKGHHVVIVGHTPRKGAVLVSRNKKKGYAIYRFTKS